MYIRVAIKTTFEGFAYFKVCSLKDIFLMQLFIQISTKKLQIMQKINISLGGNPYEITASESGEYKWIKNIPGRNLYIQILRIESITSIEQSQVGDNFRIILCSACGSLCINYKSNQQKQMIEELKLIERIIMGEPI